MTFAVSARTLERLEWAQVLEKLRDQCRTPQGRSLFGGLDTDDRGQESTVLAAGEIEHGVLQIPFETGLAATRIRLTETSEARKLLDASLAPPLGGAMDV